MNNEALGSRRDIIRAEILSNAGDQAALLGTVSDTASLLLYEITKLAAGLQQAQSIEDVRVAATPLNDLLGGLVPEVESGTVKLPYLHKGDSGSVLNEIKGRNTAVASVLINHQEQ